MSEHSLLPWVAGKSKYGETHVIYGNGGIGYAIARAETEDDAALIVRAVNAYAGLLQAACQMGAWLEAMRSEANRAEEQGDPSLQDFILGTMPDGFMETLISVSAALEAAKGEG